mmetsp:Transcript_40674/g.122476  ORF Transcript_40674/g.122476 Transcript_40674/m.122476 type:complete len:221 (-) Transcript_40674:1258-1920(-)
MPRGAGGSHPRQHRYLSSERGGRGVRYRDGHRRRHVRRRGAEDAGGRGGQVELRPVRVGRGGRGRQWRQWRQWRRRRRRRNVPGGEAGKSHGRSQLHLRAPRPVGRRHGREEGEGDIEGIGIHPRDAGEVHQGLFGGVEDEGQPGEGVVHTAHAAPAGRADQPPGHGGRHLARGLPLQVGQHPPHDLALPGLSQQRHQPHHPLHRTEEAQLLRRQLRSVR